MSGFCFCLPFQQPTPKPTKETNSQKEASQSSPTQKTQRKKQAPLLPPPILRRDTAKPADVQRTHRSPARGPARRGSPPAARPAAPRPETRRAPRRRLPPRAFPEFSPEENGSLLVLCLASHQKDNETPYRAPKNTQSAWCSLLLQSNMRSLVLLFLDQNLGDLLPVCKSAFLSACFSPYEETHGSK